MKKYKSEQIMTLLRQIEVEVANGKTTSQACKETQITAPTYYRWRKEFGGLKLDQAKQLKELERVNAKLTRLAAELWLEKRESASRHKFPWNRSKLKKGIRVCYSCYFFLALLMSIGETGRHS